MTDTKESGSGGFWYLLGLQQNQSLSSRAKQWLSLLVLGLLLSFLIAGQLAYAHSAFGLVGTAASGMGGALSLAVAEAGNLLGFVVDALDRLELDEIAGGVGGILEAIEGWIS